MKRNHIALLSGLLVLIAFLVPQRVKASHAAGGEIIYEWISDSTYRFFFKFYRDCTGVSEPPTQTLCCYNPCTNKSYNVVMNKYTGVIPGGNNGSPVSAGCSQYPSKCTDPTSLLPGYKEWWYTAVASLDGQCDSWKFATWIGSRNPQNNIPVANFYIETTFNNLYAQGNSSPYFSNKPIPYCCLNQFYTYNNGAVDPNGDSLSNEVINPLGGGSCTTPSAALKPVSTPGYPPISFPTNPLQCAGSFLISSTTGQLSFTPTQGGPSTLTIRTKEWRNGVLIGSIMRDVQVQVLPLCNSGAPSMSTVATSVTGGILQGGQVKGCVGQLLEFSYDLKSTDKDAILIGRDNHSVSVPGSSTTYQNTYQDSVRGFFSWTPSPSQSGLFTLTITLIDSTCRPPGILLSQTYTIPILIYPAPKASNDTSVCPGDALQLSVTNGGNFLWSIASGPAGSLSCTGCQYPVASPYATTKYVVASQATAFCTHNTDTVVVTTLPPPPFTPVADIVTCEGVANNMDLHVGSAPGVTYTVKWSPGTYLSSNSVANPVVTPAGDITYTIVVGATNNTCKGFDTVKVDVLDRVKINTPDTAICEGEKVQVSSAGDPRYTYAWATNDLSGGTSISNISVIDPVITPTSVGKFTYTLTAAFTGCPATNNSFDIDIQPIPSIVLQDDASMCHNDTMQLNATVTPAYDKYIYSWTPGAMLNHSNIIDPIFKATETTKLTFTASTPAGCKASDDITLTVFPAHFAEVPADMSICPNETAQLSIGGKDLKSFYWSPAQEISDVNSATPVVNPVNTRVYTAFARDINGCYDTARVKVTVKPAAVISLPREITLYPGQSYNMEPNTNGLYFSWFPAIGLSNAHISNPVIKPEVNTRYIVKASTDGHCSTTDSVDVIVNGDSYIDMPNAFTPGASTLKPLHLGDATLKKFTVFNRWGVKMFETNNIEQGWDGKYNGEAQPMGVYIYTLEAESFTGRKVSRQGNVTMIR